MAKPLGNQFGKFNGKLGNKVYRKLYGKDSVSERPLTYNKSNSAASFKTHMRTKLNNKLAKAVKSDDILYDLWDKSKSLGANKNSLILKTNGTITTYEGLNLRNSITPIHKFVPYKYHSRIYFFKMKSFSLKRNSVFAEFKLNLAALKLPDLPFHCVCIIYLGRKDIYSSDDFTLLRFSGDVCLSQTEEYTKCKITIDKESLLLIKSFDVRIIYFAVVRYNTAGKHYEWSDTFAKKL